MRGKPSTSKCEDFIGEKAGYISKEAGRLAQNRVLFRDAVRAEHVLKRICDHLFPILPTNLRSFGSRVVIQRGCLVSRFFVIVTKFYSVSRNLGLSVRSTPCFSNMSFKSLSLVAK